MTGEGQGPAGCGAGSGREPGAGRGPSAPPSTWTPEEAGVLRLPDGRLVRGRSVRRPVPPGPSPAYGLYLTGLRPPDTPWPQRWVRWPDFAVPLRFTSAADELRTAYDAAATRRVELGCAGGRGRTGTGLACLAVCAGLPPAAAIAHVRAGYDARAVEAPWQRWYVGWFAGWLTR